MGNVVPCSAPPCHCCFRCHCFTVDEPRCYRFTKSGKRRVADLDRGSETSSTVSSVVMTNGHPTPPSLDRSNSLLDSSSHSDSSPGSNPHRHRNPEDSATLKELLDGRVNLTVEIIHLKQEVEITVERSTPLLDLLVQIATQFHFNPSNYQIQLDDGTNRRDRPEASTPIGLIDVSRLQIVSKSTSIRKEYSRPQTTGLPFKPTIRFQVNLPYNQLSVIRLMPSTLFSEIKSVICESKSLDPNKYILVKPFKSGQEIVVINLEKSPEFYGIHEVTLLTKKAYEQMATQFTSAQYTSNIYLNADSNRIDSTVDLSQSTPNIHKNHSDTASVTSVRTAQSYKKKPAPPPPMASAKSMQNLSTIRDEGESSSLTSPSSPSSEMYYSYEANEGKDSKSLQEKQSSSPITIQPRRPRLTRQNSGSDSSGYHEMLSTGDTDTPTDGNSPAPPISPAPSSEDGDGASKSVSLVNCTTSERAMPVPTTRLSKLKPAPPPPGHTETSSSIVSKKRKAPLPPPRSMSSPVERMDSPCSDDLHNSFSSSDGASSTSALADDSNSHNSSLSPIVIIRSTSISEAPTDGAKESNEESSKIIQIPSEIIIQSKLNPIEEVPEASPIIPESFSKKSVPIQPDQNLKTFKSEIKPQKSNSEKVEQEKLDIKPVGLTSNDEENEENKMQVQVEISKPESNLIEQPIIEIQPVEPESEFMNITAEMVVEKRKEVLKSEIPNNSVFVENISQSETEINNLKLHQTQLSNVDDVKVNVEPVVLNISELEKINCFKKLSPITPDIKIETVDTVHDITSNGEVQCPLGHEQVTGHDELVQSMPLPLLSTELSTEKEASEPEQNHSVLAHTKLSSVIYRHLYGRVDESDMCNHNTKPGELCQDCHYYTSNYQRIRKRFVAQVSNSEPVRDVNRLVESEYAVQEVDEQCNEMNGQRAGVAVIQQWKTENDTDRLGNRGPILHGSALARNLEKQVEVTLNQLNDTLDECDQTNSKVNGHATTITSEPQSPMAMESKAKQLINSFEKSNNNSDIRMSNSFSVRDGIKKFNTINESSLRHGVLRRSTSRLQDEIETVPPVSRKLANFRIGSFKKELNIYEDAGYQKPSVPIGKHSTQIVNVNGNTAISVEPTTKPSVSQSATLSRVETVEAKLNTTSNSTNDRTTFLDELKSKTWSYRNGLVLKGQDEMTTEPVKLKSRSPIPPEEITGSEMKDKVVKMNASNELKVSMTSKVMNGNQITIEPKIIRVNAHPPNNRTPQLNTSHKPNGQVESMGGPKDMGTIPPPPPPPPSDSPIFNRAVSTNDLTQTSQLLAPKGWKSVKQVNQVNKTSAIRSPLRSVSMEQMSKNPKSNVSSENSRDALLSEIKNFHSTAKLRKVANNEPFRLEIRN